MVSQDFFDKIKNNNVQTVYKETQLRAFRIQCGSPTDHEVLTAAIRAAVAKHASPEDGTAAVPLSRCLCGFDLP